VRPPAIALAEKMDRRPNQNRQQQREEFARKLEKISFTGICHAVLDADFTTAGSDENDRTGPAQTIEPGAVAGQAAGARC